ncbi:hypothetical protein MJO28_016633 [Puccinia striiformis f. sp. tritici]|uniref:Uncharacterized protein n=1 Tax=Puccinia striiformis f. sp. tritici TaxID=168172 RepID=A0ACC0DNU1_9BASI|nr:hypothetical protein MJO28_016633 [Puccinia striiformis f. sp. tritici]
MALTSDVLCLHSQINKVVQLAAPVKTPFPVEALTTEHRDTWQVIFYHAICSYFVSSYVTDSLHIYECKKSCERLIPTIQNLLRGLSLMMRVNCLHLQAHLRIEYFLKYIVIVCENRESGFNAEHSCMDGALVSRMNDWIPNALTHKKLTWGAVLTAIYLHQSHMKFALSDAIKQNVLRSVTNFQKLNLGYGKRVTQNQFKRSLDAVA